MSVPYVREIKKQRYVYYHCTGYRGKRGDSHAREEVMQEQLASSLRELTIPPSLLQWLQEAVAWPDLT
jgi:site-specific DNA recombinase